MAITNIDKPAVGDATKLDIGSSFNLLVGGVYSLIVGSGGGSFTNSSKTSVGETWGSIESTWVAETRTWLAASQLIDNTSKPTTTITNVAKP